MEVLPYALPLAGILLLSVSLGLLVTKRQ